MKLEQLFCFQQAAKYHSISVAAKMNYVSQSSFSASISRLEKELGASLLRRTNSGVVLTEFGAKVLEKAETIFQAQEEILEAANGIRFTGTVSVNCIPGIYSRVLTETVNNVQELRPGIMISVKTEESREIARNISSGYCDFGILIKGDFLNDFRDVEYVPLFRDEYRLYVGKHSPLWNREDITIEEALQQPYIAYREEFREKNGGITGLFAEDEWPNIVFRTDDLDSMKHMIASQNYTALFPRFMAAEDIYLQTGKIHALPISDRDLSVEVGYLKSKKYRLSLLDRAVLEVLENTVQRLLAEDAG